MNTGNKEFTSKSAEALTIISRLNHYPKDFHHEPQADFDSCVEHMVDWLEQHVRRRGFLSVLFRTSRQFLRNVCYRLYHICHNYIRPISRHDRDILRDVIADSERLELLIRLLKTHDLRGGGDGKMYLQKRETRVNVAMGVDLKEILDNYHSRRFFHRAIDALELSPKEDSQSETLHS